MTIILALITALIGPLFIDWSAYHDRFEREASRILGSPVEVRGTADATILPLPRMTFSNVLVDMGPGTQLQVGRVFARLELLPLLQGEYRFVDLILDRPNLTVTLTSEGRLPETGQLRGSLSASGEVSGSDETAAADTDRDYSFENIDLYGGRVTINDPRRQEPVVLDGLTVSGSARSLQGPFRGDIRFSLNDELWYVDAATGEHGENGIRLQLRVNNETVPVALVTDGFLKHARNGPLYDGTFGFQKIRPDGDGESGGTVISEGTGGSGLIPGWDASGEFVLSSLDLRLKKLDLRRGEEGSPISLSGVATIDFSRNPYFDAVLSARQIDLDRSLGGGPEDPIEVGTALDRFITLNSSLPVSPVPGRVGFELGGLVAGGNIIRDIRLDAETRDGAWKIENAEAVLPGGTNLSLDGTFGPRGVPGFTGFIDFYSTTPATLLPWLSGKPAEAGRSGLRAFGLRGDLTLLENGGQFEDLTTFFEDGTAEGTASWSFEEGGRLTADLEGTSLDLDVLRGFAGFLTGGNEERGFEALEVDLNVSELSGAGLLATGVDLKFSNTPDRLKLDRVEIASFEGAKITAAGEFQSLGSDPQGSVRGHIEAEDAVPLVDAVRRLYPQFPALDFLDSVSPALSPLSLVVRAGANEINTVATSSLSVNGSAGGSNISVEVSLGGKPADWTTALVAADLRLSNDDSQTLLNQFGIAALPLSDLGPGNVFLTFDGVASERIVFENEVLLAGVEGGFSGSGSYTPAGPAGEISANLTGGDLNPLLLAVGAGITAVDDVLPFSVSADISAEGDAVEITRLEGQLLGSPFSGTLNGIRNINRYSVEGAIEAGTVDINRIGPVLTGQAAFDLRSTELPDVTFAEPLFSGIDADVSITAETLLASETLSLSDAGFTLGMSEDELTLEDISGKFRDADFTGNARLALDDLSASFSADGTLSGLDASLLSWEYTGEPVLSGMLDLRFDTEGSGRTLKAIASSLTGSGTFSLKDAAISPLDPGAFRRVVAIADDEDLALDGEAVARALQSELLMGPMSVSDTGGLFSVDAGVLRARNIELSDGDVRLSGGGTIDFIGDSLESTWALVSKETFSGPTVAGAVPEARLLIDGSVSDPAMVVDAEGLLAYLSLRSFERESRRIEVLQSDILERERFNRDINRIRFEEARKRRAAEAAAQAAEALQLQDGDLTGTGSEAPASN